MTDKTPSDSTIDTAAQQLNRALSGLEASLDALVHRGGLSQVATRRLFSTAGFVGSGASLWATAMVEEAWMVTALLCLYQGFNNLQGVGFKLSYLELTQRHSGVLAGGGNTLATFATFAGPLLTVRVLEATGNSWAAMFVVLAAFQASAAALYAVFISTECVDGLLEGDKKGK